MVRNHRTKELGVINACLCSHGGVAEHEHDYRSDNDRCVALQRREHRGRFTKKWRLRCPAVVESLDEAGDQLFTFLRFPPSQWKALRTTNALERINEECRRRTKTQVWRGLWGSWAMKIST